MLSNFKAFHSANLITTATLAEEPDPIIGHDYSYSSFMQTLNPRSFLINSDVTPMNCAKYQANTGNVVFEMAEKTYIDYVIATGESKDGDGSFGLSEMFDSDDDCDIISNEFFSGGEIYVSNTTSTTDAVYCGRVGSDIGYDKPGTTAEYEDGTKMGGTI